MLLSAHLETCCCYRFPHADCAVAVIFWQKDDMGSSEVPYHVIILHEMVLCVHVWASVGRTFLLPSCQLIGPHRIWGQGSSSFNSVALNIIPSFAMWNFKCKSYQLPLTECNDRILTEICMHEPVLAARLNLAWGPIPWTSLKLHYMH